MRFALFLALAAGCGATTKARGTALTLTQPCAPDQVIEPSAPFGCKATSDATESLAASQKALVEFDLEAAQANLTAASKQSLSYQQNVALWEQRGIAAAYAENEPDAKAAFDMLLAINTRHLLSYTLSPKATFVFEKVRKLERIEPQVEVTWPKDLKVGEQVPLEISVVSDPKKFLQLATIYVRERGTAAWKRASFPLSASGTSTIKLPAVGGTKSTALELYLQTSDQHGNGVFNWAEAKRPRELLLRYEPPTPWFKKWWVLTAIGSAVALGTGATVYALTREPPNSVDGGVVLK